MIATACIAGVLLMATGNAHASEQPARAFDINAQSLATALSEFARQSRREILFAPKIVADKRTEGVRGTLEPLSALSTLLKNTGLGYSTTPGGAILIAPPTSTSAMATETTAAAADPGLRLVRTGARSESMQRVQDSQYRNESERLETESSLAMADDASRKGIPEMLVKGRRSFNVDIRRTEDDVQPYVVFEAETIERSMATNLEDFLKTRLPMNMVESTNSQQVELPGNVSSINLRGLGTDETLVLVNGRRLPGVSSINGSGAIGQADINGIPISAVERIEILPATASGIYGGGATGGVVNIILKSDYNAFEVGVNYDNTFDTDSGSKRLDALAGFNLEGGRTNILLTGSYSEGNDLTVGDRDFADRAYRLYLDNTLDDFSTSFRAPLASTTNVRQRFGSAPLLLKDPNGGPAVSIESHFTHVPIGYTGIQSDGGAAFVAGAGSYNIELPRDIQGVGQGIINSPTVSSLGANLRRKFTDAIEGFVDLSWTRNEGHVLTARQTSTISLDPEDPGNPFDSRIQVAFPLPGLAFDREYTSENRLASGGVIVRLPRDWFGQAEYSWGLSRSEGISTSPILGPEATDAIRSGELNVFRDINDAVPDYAAAGYLLDSPNSFNGPFDNTHTGATLRIAGPTYELPGGPLALSVFYEHRKSEADAGFSRSQSSFDRSISLVYYADRSEEVDSASFEVTAPIISSRNARTLIHALDLQTSVRYDDYQINGVDRNPAFLAPGDPIPQANRNTARLNSTDYTAGFRYAPSPDLAFRASYGTGFLPPSVAQITPSFFTQSLGVVDPRRSGMFESIPNVLQIRNGNPNLRPEESASLSLGMILTPRALPGLRLSVDFSRIAKDDEISFTDPQTIINKEMLVPERVTRAALTQDDIDAGFAVGQITSVDASMINFAKTTVRTFDIQLDYSFDTSLGNIRAYVLTTYLQDYMTQFQPGAPNDQNAGHLFWLKWRGNAGLTLDRDTWSLDWNMQYFDSYLLYPGSVPLEFVPVFTAQQGSDSIPRQTYHDIVGRFRVGEALGLTSGILADTDLQFGIRNVFNTSPPIVASPFPSNGYSFFGDPRLRRYTVSIRKRF